MSLFLVDSDLVDDVPAKLPWWLPPREPDADWTFPQTIPSLPDPALREPEVTS
jgi:hypothetical protein